ncbi:MAG: hypothetical protein KAR42_08215 [candidate division Zixibacteria bacterium]|nr:hypothetical protein [candidate division Zixibacteria bacterium]
MNLRKISLIILLLVGLWNISGTSMAQELYWGGFVEGLWGAGIDDNNPTGRDYPVAETRLQLRLESFGDNAEVFGRIDFVQDGFDSSNYDVDLREAYIKFSVNSVNMDFKVGRQILTWGTGDLIFINDVFAKDYQSFLIGRQDQYLKAPQTAVRVEWYTGLGSFTVVGIPDFEPNITPTGDRLSFFHPNKGKIVGAADYMAPVEPDNKFENSEVAFNYSRMVKGFTLAGYAYRGFYKSPVGFDPVGYRVFYPRLNVFGASLRGQVYGGILWLEGGYFDSREDRDGNNYFIENSSMKGLVGFERQVATDLTANLQFSYEQMVDYDQYETSHTQASDFAISMGMPAPVKAEETRTLVTSRWTKMLNSQTITISLFGFYSPSEEDAYVRFSAEYKYSDELSLMAGGNIFDGKDPYTQWGQFTLNDNLYLKINYGF